MSPIAPFAALRSRVFLLLFGMFAVVVLGLSVWRLRDPLGSTHYRLQGSDVVSTHNPYRGVAGAVFTSDRMRVAVDAADAHNDRSRGTTSRFLLADVVGDTPLATALQPALKRAQQDFVRRSADGRLSAGRDVVLSIDRSLQHTLLGIAGCFVQGDDACATILPQTLTVADRRFLGGDTPRAGMVGFAVVDEDSGAVLAKGGRIADCTRQSLRRKAVRAPSGGTPVFDGQRGCSQFPDARHADWLGMPMSPAQYAAMVPGTALPETRATQQPVDPSDWSFYPGSTAKLQLAVACEQARRFPLPLEQVRSEFARSSNNDFFRQLALECAQQYRSVYLHYAKPLPLLYPPRVLVSSYPGWALRAIPSTLPDGPLMSAQRYLALDGEFARRTGQRPQLQDGEGVLLGTSRDFSTLALGDGGHRGVLLAHARTLRQLGLASRGVTEAPVMHLAHDPLAALPRESLTWLPNPAGSTHVLWVLSGVTGTGGTARAACLRVLGACPTDGIALAGKTGTSDITTGPNSVVLARHAQGDPIPSKLFVARFRAGNGRHIVIAVQVLRTRDPQTGALDDSNAAAEFGMLIFRELQRHAATVER